MKCSVEGCDREKYARNFCSMHYHRYMKHGDPHQVNVVWTEEKIEQEILNVCESLKIDRMPTATELKNIGRNDLHCKISKTKKYSGWSVHLGLRRKESETLKGQSFEGVAAKLIESKGHDVEQMSTKHPYDLLVNGLVKVDVKAGKAYMMRGSRVHSFGINKKNPTCDIYVIVALDEHDVIERTFIIPSQFLRVVSMCIGANSKYNQYIDRWDYIEQYSNFLKDVV